jgi:plastocyanin
MKKGLVIGIIAVLVIAAIIAGFYFTKAPASYAPASPVSVGGQESTTPQSNSISIKGFAFNPSTVNIKVGDSVIWTNEDSAPHTIVSDSGNEIGSGTLSSGATYSHTFSTAGTYEYHCGIHTSMKGKIIVS